MTCLGVSMLVSDVGRHRRWGGGINDMFGCVHACVGGGDAL